MCDVFVGLGALRCRTVEKVSIKNLATPRGPERSRLGSVGLRFSTGNGDDMMDRDGVMSAKRIVFVRQSRPFSLFLLCNPNNGRFSVPVVALPLERLESLHLGTSEKWRATSRRISSSINHQWSVISDDLMIDDSDHHWWLMIHLQALVISHHFFLGVHLVQFEIIFPFDFWEEFYICAGTRMFGNLAPSVDKSDLTQGRYLTYHLSSIRCTANCRSSTKNYIHSAMQLCQHFVVGLHRKISLLSSMLQ